MSKKSRQNAESQRLVPQVLPGFERSDLESWQSIVDAVALRFNKEYKGEAFDLPEEVESMPLCREKLTGTLESRISSQFWDVVKPQKNQSCLDIGCGVSFLIYPWRDWNAFFYGQEISSFATDALNSRAPQLNSKLFKGVQLAPAHQVKHEPNKFDLVIATGFSCYYPREYWTAVIASVKRVIKPDGKFIFDVIDPEAAIAEDWAILETYLGTEVHLESISDWEETIQSTGAKILKRHPGELFQLYVVRV
ncbi:MAG: class I SAM-dependent methyltransferase [Microcoleaceae cyanobacterium]